MKARELFVKTMLIIHRDDLRNPLLSIGQIRIVEAPAKKDVAGEQRQLDSHFAPGVEAGARDQRKEAAKSGSVQFSGKDFFLPALGSKHEPGSKRNVGETRNYPISQRNGSAHDHSPCSEKIRSSRCVCAQT